MACSFLQYCAMCEKQIMTPSNSILYCSERCSRKDGAKPLSASILSAPEHSRSAPGSRTTSRSNSPSPTPWTQTAPVAHVRIPTDQHGYKSDLDPTEWKPKLGGSRARNSEAYRYLSRFHQQTTGAGELEHMRLDSGRFTHKVSASMYNIPTLTPGLSHTPGTSASSPDSVEYDFHTRPLQARSNPMYAVSAGVKSIDLVTPHIPPVEVHRDTTDVDKKSLWEKKPVVRGSGGKGEGLAQLKHIMSGQDA